MLKKTPKHDELQMIPKYPPHVKELSGIDYSKSNIKAGYLIQKKESLLKSKINQTMNGLGDDDHKRKYYSFLMQNGIKIVSQVFERMDMDRKVIEALRKLQTMDNLTEREYYLKKQTLMRRLTAKAVKFLYERKKKEDKVPSLKAMAEK